jgi:2-methylcitrate dehydratase PrpD
MLAERLGSFIAETGFSDLPRGVTEMAKVRLLDLLGAGLAGYRLGLFRPILDLLNVGPGNSTVWGEGILISTRDATIVNSFMAHSTYLEDGSRSTGGHPSSAVIPAILSLGETHGVSGTNVILSLILGYEVFIRIGKAIYPSTVTRGFQPTAILACLGAAGGCSKILNLNKEGCSHALTIGANLGSGLKSALKEPASQPIQVGRSCEGGLLAAMLASRGLKGYPMILESYIDAYAEAPGKEEILQNLGETFEIEETYLKVHGGCRGNHAPVDLILKIVKENHLSPEQIGEVKIGIDSVTAASEIHSPTNGKEAQFSIPFSVAAALTYGDASIFQFTNERVREPAMRNMMERIRVEINPELDRLLSTKRGATGEVILNDGRSYRDSLDFARGEPELPLTLEEVEEKFNLLAGGVLGKRTSQVIDTVFNLDRLKRVSELTTLLKAEQKSQLKFA